MGTLRNPLLHNTETVTPKRRAVCFYFGCTQCKDHIMPVIDAGPEPDEPATSLTQDRVRDNNSLTAKVGRFLRQSAESCLNRRGRLNDDEEAYDDQ